MDIKTHLILLKELDKTSEIESCFLQDGLLQVQFYNNAKAYTYKKGSFAYFENPIKLDSNTTFKAHLFYQVSEILYFGEDSQYNPSKIKGYYRILFEDNSSQLFSDLELEIEDEEIAKRDRESKPLQETCPNLITYFAKIAEDIGLKDEEGKSLLSTSFKYLKDIESSHALYAYLRGHSQLHSDREMLLFPFGLNLSQAQAITNAFISQISIIEGPPGTGKTQSILSIIANAIYRGKSVAVLSNNNAAIANVYEKLKAYGLDLLCAFLGNRANKEAFLQSQPHLKKTANHTQSKPQSKAPQIPPESTQLESTSTAEISSLYEKVLSLFALQNTLAKDRAFLSDLVLEEAYFHANKNMNTENLINSTTNLTLPKVRGKASSHKILALKIALEMHLESQGKKQVKTKSQMPPKLSLFFKLKAVFIYRIGDFALYRRDLAEILDILDTLYYQHKKREIESKITKAETALSPLDSYLKNLNTLSQILLWRRIKKRLKTREENPPFTREDLYYKWQEFIESYPIIFSTTHSIKNTLNPNSIFDYVIVDEASQVDISTGALALSAARHIIIVGDSKQLPNVLRSEDREKITALNATFAIPHAYDAAEESFLSSTLKAVPNAPRVLLKEHYRCHPQIIGFSNARFYNNELVILSRQESKNVVSKNVDSTNVKDTQDSKNTDSKDSANLSRDSGAFPLAKDAQDSINDNVLTAYITSQGNFARGHSNKREVEVIIKEILPHLHGIESKDIGIITPYNTQKALLRKELAALTASQSLNADRESKSQANIANTAAHTAHTNAAFENLDQIEIDTVHKFQGREKEAIIIATTDNAANDFIDDPQLLNVALTRAKSRLFIIVSHRIRHEPSYLKDFIDYLSYANFAVKHSRIASIFDLLYKENQAAKTAYLKGKRRISKYDSENLIFTLLQEIITQEGFSLAIATHYPLAKMLKSLDLCDEAEQKYATNPLTHIDFVLYSTMNKLPLLCIEVDGYAFHKLDSKQHKRDTLKDNILHKYGIAFLRLSTIDSDEKSRIILAITSAMKIEK